MSAPLFAPDRPAGNRQTEPGAAGLVTALAMNAWAFKALAAAVDLRLFTVLAGGTGLPVGQLAKELGIRYRPADALVTACASLGLLERTETGYRNSADAEESLVLGKPGYLGDLVAVFDHCDPPALRKTAGALRDLDHAPRPPRDIPVASVWSTLGRLTGRALGEAADFTSAGRMLALGASADVALELCHGYSSLYATVFAPRTTCEATGEAAEAAGLGTRVTVTAGDPLNDPLPGGHDVVLLADTLSAWDPHQARAVFEKAFAALRPGGSIVVCEPLLDPDRSGPGPAALLGLRRYVKTRSGRTYSTAEIRHCLTESGFVDVRVEAVDAVPCSAAVFGRKA